MRREEIERERGMHGESKYMIERQMNILNEKILHCYKAESKKFAII